MHACMLCPLTCVCKGGKVLDGSGAHGAVRLLVTSVSATELPAALDDLQRGRGRDNGGHRWCGVPGKECGNVLSCQQPLITCREGARVVESVGEQGLATSFRQDFMMTCRNRGCVRATAACQDDAAATVHHVRASCALRHARSNAPACLHCMFALSTVV
eukprot:364758-Chlamydomonas_euryale.AAC.6